MKTSRNFLIILLALALTGSFLIQDNAAYNELNQASIISFSDEGPTEPGPGTEAKTADTAEDVYLLPVVKVDDTLMPYYMLPEINIEGKYSRDNVYPTIKTDGKYVPHILLEEVKIFAL